MAGSFAGNYNINPRTGLPYSGAPSPPPNAVDNQYKLYDAGVRTQASDYDNIMGGYRNILNNTSAGAPRAFTPYNPAQLGPATQIKPQTVAYNPSASVLDSIKNLKGLADTGGYTDQGIADLRARGISPIRAIYANAQRNMDRNRRLVGGYSPNYNAASTKMAREQSGIISDKVTDVNAQLAQAIAANKLQAAPQYSAAASGEDARRLATYQANVDAINKANAENAAATERTNNTNVGYTNEANKFNAAGRNTFDEQELAKHLEALRGMTGLYGTTPALANTFGNQALETAHLQNTINQQQNAPALSLLGSNMRRFG